jgi:hypothetical protein
MDELEAEDLDRLSDEALEADFAELERARRALEAERLRRLAQIHRRETWRRDGFLTTSAWLAHRFRIGWNAVMRHIRCASALERMPATRDALSAGDLSLSALLVLVQGHEAHPAEFERQEEALVGAARVLTHRELRRAVTYWRQALDGPKAIEDAQFRWHRRRLYVSPLLDGMVRVDGDLDPDTGQTLITALRAVMDAEGHRTSDDLRTAAQVRADALGELCRQWLDGGSRPQVAGERPHVTVTVDLAALEGATGARSELEDCGPMPPEAARRWACDASVSRIVTGGRSEPLDVGRRTPTVPPPLRRAVVIRDGHCQFPGCERPHPWCDAHHVRHWADGGSTALANLVLLCRRHHRLVHEGGFGLEMGARGPVFRRPNGTVLEDRAPP